MTIETPFLNVEKYAGDGVTKTFGFGFRTFEAVDVVVVAADANGVETTLNPETDYYVSRNSSGQGGTVTLSKAPASGTSLAITRSVPVTQEVDLVNQGEFYAETIEEAFDKVTATIQDLREMAKRHLTVPITSSKTPQQVLNEVLDIAANAQKSADLANKVYQEAVALKNEVQRVIEEEGAEQIDLVEAEGATQVANVVAEGDKQAIRLEAIADHEELLEGVRCMERVWTISADVEEGSTITLPDSMRYVVGRDHLRMAYNGVVLFKDGAFSEIGSPDTIATTFKINMPLQVGDELMAWTVPLGRGSSEDVLTRVATLEDALADLSAKVVYRGEE